MNIHHPDIQYNKPQYLAAFVILHTDIWRVKYNFLTWMICQIRVITEATYVCDRPQNRILYYQPPHAETNKINFWYNNFALGKLYLLNE